MFGLILKRWSQGLSKYQKVNSKKCGGKFGFTFLAIFFILPSDHQPVIIKHQKIDCNDLEGSGMKSRMREDRMITIMKVHKIECSKSRQVTK